MIKPPERMAGRERRANRCAAWRGSHGNERAGRGRMGNAGPAVFFSIPLPPNSFFLTGPAVNVYCGGDE